jgi:transposase
MPRHQPVIPCSPGDLSILTEWASSRTLEARQVERARIVLRCIHGEAVKDIARDLGVRPNTVIDWRRRFAGEGLTGLFDRPRSGKPKQYPEDFRKQVLAVLDLKPPSGQATWDGPAVAAHLRQEGIVPHASADAVWRVLRKEGIGLQRHRSWCVSTDPEFAAKAADIVGLYLNPPENAVVFSVDEKPSIQALERKTGYVQTSNGAIVRGYKSTYRRHGTLNLFAALRIATGAIRTQITKQKRRVEFLEFMDTVVSELTPDTEVHVILDNYVIHKKNDPWLAAHPNVNFHYTPTSASWLNMVEIWFGILTRKALRGASFRTTDELRVAIEEFIAAYSQNAKPFVWRKREVKGSQIRDTIVNLRN